MKKSRRGVRGRIGFFLLPILFLAGLGIFSYPFVSNWINERQAALWIGDYEEQVSALSKEEKEEQRAKAEAYNNALIGQPVEDPFVPGSGVQLPQNYLEVLNVTDVMAYIEIPRIKVLLPVYHGVGEEALKNGAGHMEGTSLPVGGSGTHCLLTGHTGLPEAKLFTDLTDLEVGDQFYIRVLESELVYQVDRIRVIEPDDLGSLYTQEGEDYVTLITCTPYGVNSHRLLVRGSRIYQKTETVALAGGDDRGYILLFTGAAILFLLTSGLCFRDRRRKKWNLSYLGSEKLRGGNP